MRSELSKPLNFQKKSIQISHFETDVIYQLKKKFWKSSIENSNRAAVLHLVFYGHKKGLYSSHLPMIGEDINVIVQCIDF